MNLRGFFKAAAGLATMPLALPVALPAAAAPAAAATIKTQFAEALTDTGHTHSLYVDELASHTHGVGLRGYENRPRRVRSAGYLRHLHLTGI